MREIKITVPKEFTVLEVTSFRDNVNELMNQGNNSFILDFSNCIFIDSTGLGVLVSIYKKCVEHGGNLHLVSVNNHDVRKVFELTRLNKIFNI